MYDFAYFLSSLICYVQCHVIAQVRRVVRTSQFPLSEFLLVFVPVYLLYILVVDNYNVYPTTFTHIILI